MPASSHPGSSPRSGFRWRPATVRPKASGRATTSTAGACPGRPKASSCTNFDALTTPAPDPFWGKGVRLSMTESFTAEAQQSNVLDVSWADRPVWWRRALPVVDARGPRREERRARARGLVAIQTVLAVLGRASARRPHGPMLDYHAHGRRRGRVARRTRDAAARACFANSGGGGARTASRRPKHSPLWHCDPSTHLSPPASLPPVGKSHASRVSVRHAPRAFRATAQACSLGAVSVWPRRASEERQALT